MWNPLWSTALYKVDTRDVCSQIKDHVSTQQEARHLEAKEEETHHISALTLDFQDYEKINFCFSSQPVWNPYNHKPINKGALN